MSNNGQQLWTEAEGLKVAHQKLLSEIGSMYMAIEAAKLQVAEMEKQLEDKKQQCKSLEQAFNKTAEAIAKSSGISNGNIVLDFDKREVTDGQVPDRGDGQS